MAGFKIVETPLVCVSVLRIMALFLKALKTLKMRISTGTGKLTMSLLLLMLNLLNQHYIKRKNLLLSLVQIRILVMRQKCAILHPILPSHHKATHMAIHKATHMAILLHPILPSRHKATYPILIALIISSYTIMVTTQITRRADTIIGLAVSV